jgi:uncharacterized protein (DUF1810 family)
MTGPFNLQRFVAAQDSVYADVCDELSQGDKQTHWMWFIFPQLAGLGHSAMAQRYGISGRQEALAYLAHPVLGIRLIHCTELMLAHKNRSAQQILGAVDQQKLCSSMTLFSAVQIEATVFQRALQQFFAGGVDQNTLQLLSSVKPARFEP